MHRFLQQYGSSLLPGETDGQLLERFLTARDPSPLDRLVGRHAGMVWGGGVVTGAVALAEEVVRATASSRLPLVGVVGTVTEDL